MSCVNIMSSTAVANLKNKLFMLKIWQIAGKIKNTAKKCTFQIYFLLFQNWLKKWKMPLFKSSCHSLSRQERIINVFESLFSEKSTRKDVFSAQLFFVVVVLNFNLSCNLKGAYAIIVWLLAFVQHLKGYHMTMGHNSAILFDKIMSPVEFLRTICV